jgi:Domain of unknown function (DUF1851)
MTGANHPPLPAPPPPGIGHDCDVRFDRLGSSFRVAGGAPTGEATQWPFAQEQLDQVFESLGGVCLNEGLYRVHTAESALVWSRLIADGFPAFQDRAIPFGFDWLGRQFAVDRDRTTPSGHLCLLLEPGTGQALELPFTAVELHQDGLIDLTDAALAVDFYLRWRHDADDADPLRAAECIGYRIPLFLGGADDPSNLERTDMAVYWSLVAQLIHQAATDPSTPILGVRRHQKP